MNQLLNDAINYHQAPGNSPLLIILAYLLLMSVIAFLAFGLDKYKAKAGHWRISERTLLSLSLVGGWPGSVLAMKTFHHKQRKQSFVRLLILASIANIALLVAVLSLLVAR
ncbi:DUF1294 domain-containing protein [Thalassotalea ponticola]|uniref:DUF1294 domain-containing protein n=1 Tax=Thalassotalea ponticola TaxID=1523392 RepID=UPI0025B31B73|nr:DUF1294 domain-containing protein [Thalassotalea ponticola]MDN3651181.1 DUF1294 domain-containing protein [Thalassotalea ponticola]